MRLIILLGIFSAAVNAENEEAKQYNVVCYYGSWAVYRPGAGKYDVENIDPKLCTHYIYTFAGLNSATSKIRSLDPWNDLDDNYGKGAFKRFVKLKEKNPALKTILGIGGWNEGSTKYSEMAASSSKRATFVNSVVEFLNKFGFDGLDLDWEYPAERGGEPIDKVDYLKLVTELKTALSAQGLSLSAAVAPGKKTIDDSYKLRELGAQLDIVNVMAYDYHGSWDPFTGHVAPLYLSPLDLQHPAYMYFSVNYTVQYYIDSGIPRNKIAMGIPLYGHGFLLDKQENHGLYAPARQPQPACPFTRQAGVCGFNEICAMMKGDDASWTHVRDKYQKAIYSYKGRTWVGYDDLQAINLKTKYIKDMGLGGSMVWSIETDDFHNNCNLGMANPLMTTIWKNLNGDIPPTPTTTPNPHPPSTTSAPPTSPTPVPSHVCKSSGLNPDPDKKCSPIFYACVIDGDHWDVTPERCADGTVFDSHAKTCIWKRASADCRNIILLGGLEA